MKFIKEFNSQTKLLVIFIVITTISLSCIDQANSISIKSTSKVNTNNANLSKSISSTKQEAQNVQGPPPQPEQQNLPPNTQLEVKNYEAIWNKLFLTGSKRPSDICPTKVGINYMPVKKPSAPEMRDSLLPKKKPNVFYNKPGFEDSAYVWDYMDSLIQAKIVPIFQQLWQTGKGTPANEKIRDPYNVREQVLYYYTNGARSQFFYDPFKEQDMNKLGSSLQLLNEHIHFETMKQGVTIPQIENIFKSLGMSYNPSQIGWEKKKVDYYDFNGDGTLSTEEFLFMIIWENRTKLNDPKLFKAITDTIIDPIFDYLDCDSDGYITAEGMWVGFKELLRPTNDCDMYQCKNQKSKLHMRTGAVGDVVLKNAEENQGYLNKDEFRKAVILSYWDRQVNNNTIYTDDSNNLKHLRWMNKTFDINCADGSTIR